MSLDTHAHANPHHEHPDVVGSRNRLGVILLIVADAAFAFSMMFVFFYLKAQNVNDMWLPKGNEDHAAIEPVSSMGAWNITLICVVGLLAHFYGLKGVRKGNQTQLKLGGLVALVASIVALAYQVQIMATVPFTFYEGAYVACFYLFAIMNIVHLALTVLFSFGNWFRSTKGIYKNDHWHVDIVNVWWAWMVVTSLLGAFALSLAK
jgi:heme/copper-type cytochrome/quinol oxidase subunit 3